MIIGQRHKNEIYKLVLLRHGESVWNAKNLFTGWVDVPLSEKGMAEAAKGGLLLKEEGILPDIVFTSFLRRAITTANIALDKADRHWIEVKRSWRLNERHYGALQGKDKSEIRKTYGDDQFMQWRRSYDIPPPPIEDDSEYSQSNDVRYLGEPIPKSESLKDVLQRAKPYLFSRIFPELELGKTVLVAAHGNSLRAIVKYLENISDEEISNLNIPTGIPLYYELNTSFRILAKGRYLDPDAQKAIDAVANQGK
ncbi:MAG: phosphoglyceromutase [Bifidobacteriaceae bacterium]|jgi:2,3-bisphosphoglycerate-dependent phosphoglycerate mutase|nr:phosphoglyceromutase [Bifidobacteriaceae bacterium]